MNHTNILKRAFNITVNYRALWIFGMLLALTAGGSSGGAGNSGSRYTANNPGNGNPPFGPFPQITPDVTNTIIGVAVGVACLILVLIIVGIVLHYVAENAAIRMVDRHENDGSMLTVREGFGLGWSRSAWTMFLVDLLPRLGLLVVFLLALGLSALPLLVWLTQSVPLRILGSIIAAGLILLLIFATIIASLALSLVLLFARRASALEGLGVRASLRRGYELVRGHLGDSILLGVMMFGIGLLWGVLMIPVGIALLLAAALVGGLPALLIGGIVGLFTQGATPWIVAAVIGIPIALVAVLIPGSLISGWHQIFSVNAWTLAYREAVALDKTREGGELPVASA